jgi:hypothetical protein
MKMGSHDIKIIVTINKVKLLIDRKNHAEFKSVFNNKK